MQPSIITSVKDFQLITAIKIFQIFNSLLSLHGLVKVELKQDPLDPTA